MRYNQAFRFVPGLNCFHENQGLPTVPDVMRGEEVQIFGAMQLTGVRDGLFVLEHGKTNNFEEHPCFLERRIYGSVNFSFFGIQG